jgi:hypothetical protein
VDARETYTMGRSARAAEAVVHEGRVRFIGTLRVVVALGALGVVVGIVWAGLPGAAWYVVGALVLGFAALVVWHARVHSARDRALAAKRFHERGLDRLEGRWMRFVSTGERFAKERVGAHAFLDDLDVFGRASLFQLLDASETRFGAERLASLLAFEGAVTPDEVRARQAAVKDLVPRIAFRERLSAQGAVLGDGVEDRPDPSAFLAWSESARTIGDGSLLAIASKLLPLVVIGAFFAAPALHLPRAVALVPLAIELAILARLREALAQITSSASTREQSLARYGEMLAAIEEEPFEAPLLLELRARLSATGAEATREMARLSRILGFLDARQNEVFRIFIAPVLMWDVSCALALQGWRARAGKHVRAWLDALADVEALASFAGFAFDRPDHAFPRLEEAPAFVAKKLGHPLIAADRRVTNDVSIPGAGSALVVTGSNMSGKSTLLRAIGVAAVLARAGAPVCAEELVVGRVRVATSMRVSDSLEEGTSRFYAELKKLKLVLSCAREGPTLFLLDEILHGTNSRERLIGARAMLKELLARGALGAVSTHDLALGDLEQESGGRAKNVHFEEQVEGDLMRFDYRLREGIVQSSNALRLMRIVGLDVV